MKKFLTWVALLATLLGFSLSAQPVVIDDAGSAVVSDPSIIAPKNIKPQGLPVKRTSPIVTKVTAHYGPRVQDAGYLSFAKEVVSTILTNGTSKTQLGNKLLPRYLTGNPVTNTIWFSVEFWSYEPFTVDDIRCEIGSTPNNLFGKTNILDNIQNIYSDTSVGEFWNNDGSKKVISSGAWNSQPVNRFIFLGVPSKTLLENSEAQVAADTAWLLAFGNFTLSSLWTFWEGGEKVSKATKILETHPAPVISGGLKISTVANRTNTYNVRFPEFSGTGHLQGSETPNGVWITFGEYSSGSSVDITLSRPWQFFRLLVE